MPRPAAAPPALLLAVSLGAAAALPAQAPAPGALVRVTTVAPFAPPTAAPGQELRVQAAGRLLTIDTAGVTVRASEGWQQTFPASAVRRLEVRRAAGPCAGAARRVACGAAGAVAGGLAGLLAGDLTGRRRDLSGGLDGTATADENARVRRVRRARGAAVGAALGVAVSVPLGRTRWRQVAGWPPAAR